MEVEEHELDQLSFFDACLIIVSSKIPWTVNCYLAFMALSVYSEVAKPGSDTSRMFSPAAW